MNQHDTQVLVYGIAVGMTLLGTLERVVFPLVASFAARRRRMIRAGR